MDPVTIIGVIVGGIVGAFAGMFVHAAATRLPAGLGPLGRPVCTSCEALVPQEQLLPGRRGTCATCKCPLPWHKPATEAAAAGLTTLALAFHGITYQGITVALFSLLLLLILRIDWQHHLIYNATIGPGLVLALGAAALESGQALLSAAIAAVAAAALFAGFFLLAILIYRQRALGFGDILLAGLIGAMTGMGEVFPAIFVGMLMAGLGGIFLILIGKRGRRDYIPYGAYLCAGAILVLLTS